MLAVLISSVRMAGVAVIVDIAQVVQKVWRAHTQIVAVLVARVVAEEGVTTAVMAAAA